MNLPPLPEPLYPWAGRERAYCDCFTADQLRDYAAEAVRVALEQAEAAVMSQVEACAEYTYGHPRHKAVEWAKEDKFDSECQKAEELLSIAARAIRALKGTP